MTETVGIVVGGFSMIQQLPTTKSNRDSQKTDQSEGFSHFKSFKQHAGSLARGSSNELNEAFTSGTAQAFTAGSFSPCPRW